MHGLLDGIARTLFATWMAYALAHGVPRVLWPFLVVEAALAVLELGPWLLHHNTRLLDRRSGTGSRRSRAGHIAVWPASIWIGKFRHRLQLPCRAAGLARMPGPVGGDRGSTDAAGAPGGPLSGSGGAEFTAIRSAVAAVCPARATAGGDDAGRPLPGAGRAGRMGAHG
ncbi:hypothetical protein [Streptomyces sp. ASQP_92]|uniref:hypothetical protein n=1 Tax=Streptomyces sp. ASQP_92 TaxID=2979116 RepID=UPI0037D99971